MHHRGQESPMDFQWENSSGRVDPTSPFTMTSLKTTLAEETPYKNSNISDLQATPSKSKELFSLTTPYGPKKPSDTIPTTPLITKSNLSFETPPWGQNRPASKDNDAESDAPTPEPPALRLSRRANTRSTFTTPSRLTGRGELRKGKHYDGAILKPRRRRNQFLLEHGSEDEGDSDNGDDRVPNNSSTSVQVKKSSVEEWIATHRNIPLIISDYIQLVVNGVLLTVCLYMIYGFLTTIRNDVDQKVQEISSEIVQHMASCSKSYIENRCAPDIRVPAMEIQCSVWEACMNRDPEKIGRAKVSAQTFAEIVNSFVNNISYKTMFFTSFLIMGSFLTSNFAFGYLRGRALDHERPYLPHSHGTDNRVIGSLNSLHGNLASLVEPSEYRLGVDYGR